MTKSLALILLAGLTLAAVPALASARAAGLPAASLSAAPSGLPPDPGANSTGSTATEPTATAYAVPLAGPVQVLRAFAAPATPYAAGHRGVDLAAAAGATVRAAAPGVVSFAGAVAGRGIVVITHPGGLRTEYEPVHPLVTRGQAVARGDPIAEVSGSHAACAPASCLHWGARRGDSYLDPMSLLSGSGPLGAVRLIPAPG